MDEIVRAAVELGVAQLQPLFSERCEVKLDAGRAAARLARWRVIAIEACKQSGNPFLPHIYEPLSLAAWLVASAGQGMRFVGSLEADAVPLALFKPGVEIPAQLTLLIGPEGDLSPGEYALARRHGLCAVRLGENVLRVPTAALYALAALDQLRQRAWPPACLG
jgi:16S rRNA (uracil1498-N3)-methyltransferase